MGEKKRNAEGLRPLCTPFAGVRTTNHPLSTLSFPRKQQSRKDVQMIGLRQGHTEIPLGSPLGKGEEQRRLGDTPSSPGRRTSPTPLYALFGFRIWDLARRQRGFAPLHAPTGGTGEAKLARDAQTLPNPCPL